MDSRIADTLIDELKELSEHMRRVSGMVAFAADDDDQYYRACELMGAANMVSSWADAIANGGD